MVAESQTQGVLSQNGTCKNGTPNNASQNGSLKKNGSCVTVESPSHISEFYPKNNLGCSEEEWKARVDLAAIHRLCNNNCWNEGIQNHLTASVPGHTDQFLIIAFGLLWNQVTASNLLTVDCEGKVLRGEGKPEATAFWIHNRLHLKHPLAGCVAHTHQPWATALCCLQDMELPMCHQNNLRFYDDIAYDRQYKGLILDGYEGDRLAKVMDGKRTLLHANHGIIVCTETVAEAFDYLYYLEKAGEITVKAMSTGRPLQLIPDNVCKMFHTDMEPPHLVKEFARLHLESHKKQFLKTADADYCL